MKTMFRFSGRFLVLSSALMLSAFSLTSCDKDDDDDNDNLYTISGNASGAQVVPAVTGTGGGTIVGTFNTDNNTLTYTTNWTGLTGAPTSGSFYTGASGANGTMIGSGWTMGSGLGTTGTHSGTMVLTADQWNNLRSGNWYYSLGTASNTNGEVRGQITATQMQ
jgi:hypothetical protein